MADYLLKKTWRIEERVKELLEQACGVRLTERQDVYQPWDKYVREPRNKLSHGEQIVVDEAAAENAHQATWQVLPGREESAERANAKKDGMSVPGGKWRC